MNYTRIYQNIIDNARTKNRTRHDGIYYESHHIIPKCIGGTNDIHNLVLLTPKEHFICHKLLTKIHPDNCSLIRAFWIMCNAKNAHQTSRYTISSKAYQEARILYSSIQVSDSTRTKMSNSRKGINHSEATKKKIAISNSKPKDLIVCIHCNKTVSVGANASRWHFDNCKQKPGNEAIIRKSGTHGIIVTCDHCNMSGGINVMKRWHFNNCKKKQLIFW
jgi:hypothetical protein